MAGKLVKCTVAAVLALLAASGTAFADLPAGSKAALGNAMAGFEARLKEDAARGAPPRLAEPADKPAFEALFDRAAILGASPYSAAELEPLLGIFGGYFSLTKVYLGFGGGGATLGDNEFAYQDELSRLAEMMVASAGAIAEAMTDTVAKADGNVPEDRKPGLARMRAGVSQVVSGVISLLDNPRYSKENKILLANAIAAAGPQLSPILPIEERNNFAQTAIKSLLNTPPEAAAPIQEFMNAMGRQDCEDLCALR